MHIKGVHFLCSIKWSSIAISWGRNGVIQSGLDSCSYQTGCKSFWWNRKFSGLIFCVFVDIYLYWKSIITKYEVFNRCEKILYAILGVRPYTGIVGRWERCGYLPAVKYPAWYLCLSYKSSVGVNDVKDCDETVWNMWRDLSCVSCVCVLGLGYAFVSFWVCRVVVRLVVGFVSLFCVGPCSCVRCSVFHACCSFVCLSGARWCHLQWARGLWSVIMIDACLGLYLILSFQIRYRLGWLLSVCLVFIVVFLVLFFLYG